MAPVVIIPVCFLGVSYFSTPFGSSGSSVLLNNSSLLDRMSVTWPNALKLMSHDNSLFTTFWGRGLSGIGAAQNLANSSYERNHYNPADNLFVFLFVSFGVGFLFFFLSLAKSLIIIETLPPRPRIIFFSVFVYLMLLGITSNVIEAVYPVLFLGMIFALPARATQAEKVPLREATPTDFASHLSARQRVGPRVLSGRTP